MARICSSHRLRRLLQYQLRRFLVGSGSHFYPGQGSRVRRRRTRFPSGRKRNNPNSLGTDLYQSARSKTGLNRLVRLVLHPNILL